VQDEDDDMEDASMIENNDSKQRQVRQQLLIAPRKSKVEPDQETLTEIHENNLLWIKAVIEFFDLTQIALNEKESSLRIEEFFCNIRR
jgi:hypothetical protein